MDLDHLVIAVDFSGASLAAARWVARYFAPESVLTLLHVVEPPHLPRFLEGLLDGDRQEREARERAAGRLAEAAALLDGARVRVEVGLGDPAPTIAGTAEAVRADAVVVGAHGGGTGRPGLLGSTAERLAGASGVPVMVAQRLPAGAPRRILAAVDASPLARTVLRWAGFLARRFDARLVVLHAFQPMLYGPVTFARSVEAPHRLTGEVDRQARDWLDDELRAAGLEPDAVESNVRHGHAVIVIPEEAERLHAELIVMGSRGAGAVRRLLLGSTASVVLRSVARPVLIVPPGA